MMIEQRPVRTDVKELRVQLPVEYLVRLHSLKILKGKEIRESVEEALDMYFATIQPQKTSNAKSASQ